jgi:hypothetical protein
MTLGNRGSELTSKDINCVGVTSLAAAVTACPYSKQQLVNSLSVGGTPGDDYIFRLQQYDVEAIDMQGPVPPGSTSRKREPMESRCKHLPPVQSNSCALRQFDKGLGRILMLCGPLYFSGFRVP